MTLYEKSLGTILASRFVARADDLGRELTDAEVRKEARYQLNDIPYKGFDEEEERTAILEMKNLLKCR
jgi:hypothetical protein